MNSAVLANLWVCYLQFCYFLVSRKRVYIRFGWSKFYFTLGHFLDCWTIFNFQLLNLLIFQKELILKKNITDILKSLEFIIFTILTSKNSNRFSCWFRSRFTSHVVSLTSVKCKCLAIFTKVFLLVLTSLF